MEQTHTLTLCQTPAAARSAARWGEIVAGTALITFSPLSIFIYAIHPNLFSLRPVADLDEWISEWHYNDLLHFAHALMLLAAPLLIVTALYFMYRLSDLARGWGWLGGGMAILGAVILAADKGALCLVNSAFDTLPAAEFEQLRPGLQVMMDRAGWLALIWLLVLLPVGFAVQGVGLWRTRVVPRWQAGCITVGALLLANPDIEIISLVASLLLAVGMMPEGARLLRGSVVQR